MFLSAIMPQWLMGLFLAHHRTGAIAESFNFAISGE
jgi:hypothetical protein